MRLARGEAGAKPAIAATPAFLEEADFESRAEEETMGVRNLVTIN